MIKLSKSLTALAHALFWSAPILFMVFFVGGNMPKDTFDGIDPMYFIWINFGLYGLINVGIFYFVLYLVIPYSLNQKNYLKFLFFALLTLMIFAVLKYLVSLSFKGLYFGVGSPDDPNYHRPFRYMLATFIPSGLMVFLAVVYKLLVDWFKNEQIKNDLKLEKMNAELQFLKSQINPHFLFNTLNNIYALAYKQSAQTPEAILKLSEIMRYMLYETEDHKVLLSEELKYLNNYIELNRIRYKENLNIEFKIEGVLGTQRIMPLLLISFIENIFKHGIVDQASKPVEIYIKVDDTHLIFSAKNYIHKHNKDESSGIGLKNIFRRLDLGYEGKHQIATTSTEEKFEVNLKLEF